MGAKKHTPKGKAALKRQRSGRARHSSRAKSGASFAHRGQQQPGVSPEFSEPIPDK